jgi:hypothetical protein
MNQDIISEWHCRSCVEVFTTRGKRDAHHRKVHQKIITVAALFDNKNTVKRSDNGNYECICGKNYMCGISLRRHRKTCEMANDVLEVEVVEGC